MIPSVLSQQLRQSVGIVDRLLSEDEGVFKGPFLSIAGCEDVGDVLKAPG